MLPDWFRYFRKRLTNAQYQLRNAACYGRTTAVLRNRAFTGVPYQPWRGRTSTHWNGPHVDGFHKPGCVR